MALWSILGPRPVQLLAFESFGKDWVTDVVKELKIDAEVLSAPYGALPDLTKVRPDADLVFTWNGTTSGVKVPKMCIRDRRRVGERLLTMGARAVLMKGGHVPGESVIDLLMTPDGETLFEGARIDTRHTHGTGCTLASACAVGLAQGMRLEHAVARGWAYTAEAIRRAPGFGAGAGPLDHAWPTVSYTHLLGWRPLSRR